MVSGREGGGSLGPVPARHPGAGKRSRRRGSGCVGGADGRACGNWRRHSWVPYTPLPAARTRGFSPGRWDLLFPPWGSTPSFFFFFYLRICETADISHWPSFFPGIISLENGRAAASGHSEEHCGDGRVAVRRLQSIAGQTFCRATTTKHKTNFKKPTKTKNPRLKIARQVRSESFRDVDRALSVCGADLTSFTTDPGVLAAAPREVARLSESAGTGLRRLGSGVEAGPSRVRRSEVSLERQEVGPGCGARRRARRLLQGFAWEAPGREAPAPNLELP